jgi:hypothetical protein
MKTSIFWDITPSSPVEVNQHFRGTHLACCLFHADFLLVLLFDPQDGGDTFLQNVRWLSLDCLALYPKEQNSSTVLIFSIIKKTVDQATLARNTKQHTK